MVLCTACTMLWGESALAFVHKHMKAARCAYSHSCCSGHARVSQPVCDALPKPNWPSLGVASLQSKLWRGGCQPVAAVGTAVVAALANMTNPDVVKQLSVLHSRHQSSSQRHLSGSRSKCERIKSQTVKAADQQRTAAAKQLPEPDARDTRVSWRCVCARESCQIIVLSRASFFYSKL